MNDKDWDDYLRGTAGYTNGSLYGDLGKSTSEISPLPPVHRPSSKVSYGSTPAHIAGASRSNFKNSDDTESGFSIFQECHDTAVDLVEEITKDINKKVFFYLATIGVFGGIIYGLVVGLSFAKYISLAALSGVIAYFSIHLLSYVFGFLLQLLLFVIFFTIIAAVVLGVVWIINAII